MCSSELFKAFHNCLPLIDLLVSVASVLKALKKSSQSQILAACKVESCTVKARVPVHNLRLLGTRRSLYATRCEVLIYAWTALQIETFKEYKSTSKLSHRAVSGENTVIFMISFNYICRKLLDGVLELTCDEVSFTLGDYVYCS